MSQPLAGRPAAGGPPFVVRLALGALVLAVVVWLFGLLGQWGVRNNWFSVVDRLVIDAVPDTSITAFFVAVTSLGTVTGVVAISLLMLLVLLWRRMFREAGALLTSLLSSVYTNSFVKEWVARDRPTHAGIVDPGGFSYLSGHAFVCTVVFGHFAYLMIQRAERSVTRWVIGGLTVVLVGLIGLSRIYLGVHYASDVIGGFALGAIWIVVWVAVFRPWVAVRR